MTYQIIPGCGIGDAMIMMVLAYQLYQEGQSIVVYHPLHQELSELFPYATFRSRDHISTDTAAKKTIIEYDNSALSKKLLEKKQQRVNKDLIFVFANQFQLALKHDIVISKKKPFAQSLAKKHTQQLVSNGITLPSHLRKGRYSQRIVIHPSRSNEDHVFPLTRFERIAKALNTKGYDVVFLKAGQDSFRAQYPVYQVKNLADLASYLYESALLVGNDSGPGHVASSVGIPTVTLGKTRKHLAIWRPGLHHNIPIYPLIPVPNLPFLGLKRDDYWHRAIMDSQVIQAVNKLMVQ